MKVGFIGLGRMGGHMCSNVIKAGFETYVSDLVPALVEQKVAEGAIGCKDNLEVAANMDIGFTMLPNGAIVEAVMCGPKGVLSHCKPGTIIVDMSSVAPGTTQKMAKIAAEHGVKYMDAPVSGGTIGAQKGTLTIMCGADEETFEKAKPVLEAIGKRIMRIGGTGMGDAMKIVNNMLLGANMATGSMAKVETSRFARADLEHELVMLDDDMKLEALPQTNYIKAIVTAELPMDLERKGQQSYQGDLYVRFLGFGNGSLKALYDRSEGFFRRQIILTTRPKDASRTDDPFIAEKMCAEAEGIFLWCLEGLRRLIANSYSFTLSERARENMAEAVSDGNNAVDFMKSEGYIRLKADAEASSRDIYAVYKLWCEDNALNPLSPRSLSAHLIENQEVYGLEPTNKIYLPGGRRVRGFMGVELLQRAM